MRLHLELKVQSSQLIWRLEVLSACEAESTRTSASDAVTCPVIAPSSTRDDVPREKIAIKLNPRNLYNQMNKYKEITASKHIHEYI